MAFGLWPRPASAAARAWCASVALQRQVLVLVRAATGGARSLQAQLQVELHVELQVGPQRELRGVGQIVVRALLGRDRVRAGPGAARRDIGRAIAPITGIDIVVIAFKRKSSSWKFLFLQSTFVRGSPLIKNRLSIPRLSMFAVASAAAAFLLPATPCRSVAGSSRLGLAAPRMQMQAREPETPMTPPHPAVHDPPVAPAHDR